MAPLFHSPRTWDHGGSRSDAVLALAPVLLLGLAATGRIDGPATAPLFGLVVGPGTAVAAALYYAAWRITPTRQDAWVAAAVTMLGLECLTLFALQIAAPDEVAAKPFWMMAAAVVSQGAILGCAVLAGRRTLRLDPAVAGCLAGAALGLVRLVGVAWLPHVGTPPAVDVALAAACVAVLVGTVVAIHAVTDLRLSTRVRLAVATAALSLAPLATYVGGDAGAGAGTALGLAVVGAVVLLATAIDVLRRAVSQDRAETDELSHRLHEVEADIRTRRARMHEINSTIAGISSATQVMRDRRRLTPRRCRMLEDMVETELARLGRLLAEPVDGHPGDDRDEQPVRSGRATTHPEASGLQVLDGAAGEDAAVDLDATVERLVLSQTVRGGQVTWLPSGRLVSGDEDVVAEILNILLDNAVKHGGSAVHVAVETDDGTGDTGDTGGVVEVVVSDSGPGISPAVRERLFEWGARGPGSRGQGIGLNVAWSLAESQGGYLHLRDTSGPGATFVVGLPAVRERDDAAAQLA